MTNINYNVHLEGEQILYFTAIEIADRDKLDMQVHSELLLTCRIYCKYLQNIFTPRHKQKHVQSFKCGS